MIQEKDELKVTLFDVISDAEKLKSLIDVNTEEKEIQIGRQKDQNDDIIHHLQVQVKEFENGKRIMEKKEKAYLSKLSKINI